MSLLGSAGSTGSGAMGESSLKSTPASVQIVEYLSATAERVQPRSLGWMNIVKESWMVCQEKELRSWMLDVARPVGRVRCAPVGDVPSDVRVRAAQRGRDQPAAHLSTTISLLP